MNDIYCHLCTFLTDIDKINFLSSSTTLHGLKSKIFFNDRISHKQNNTSLVL